VTEPAGRADGKNGGRQLQAYTSP